MADVIDITTGEKISDIRFLMAQPWPANRKKGDFRREWAERADAEKRRVICGFCGRRSRMVDGPTGRHWFASHECGGNAA